MTFPDVIETERLTLRRPRPSDAGPMRHYAGDFRVAKQLTRVPHPYPPGAAEAFIERSLADRTAEHVWVMDATKSDGAEFIGTIGLQRKKGEVILGYWVGPPFWNTGYASEAATAVVEAARAAGCARITSGVVETNEASAHVLVNAGFRETGPGEAYGVAVGAMMPMRMFELVFAETTA